MITVLAIAALLELQPTVTMAAQPNDRVRAEAFRSDAGITSPDLLLAGGVIEQSAEAPHEGGGMVRLVRTTNRSGQLVFIMTPVAGSGMHEDWACRFTQLSEVGENNMPRALAWCTSLMNHTPRTVDLSGFRAPGT